MADVNMDQIVETLSNMTVMQIASLTKLLEGKWGVTAAPVFSGGGGGGGGVAPVAEKAAEQTEFTVVLTGSGAQKIGVIKVVREITSLGLKEAKDLVDGVPKDLKVGVPKDEAEAIKKKIVDAGGTVEIK